MMTTMTMSALKITAMTMMTVEWRAPADGSIGGAAQPQPRSQEMSPLFLLLSSSSSLLIIIIIIVISVITIFTYLASSPICKFVKWYNLGKLKMKTNHSKHSGFFERQLIITISIRRQTHHDFQLRNISLGLNNARYVFQLTIPEIFLDDSWSLRRENASVGDRGRLPLGLCRVSTSEKKNTHLTNTNTMTFTNTKTLTSQIQIQWHSQIQKH